MKYERWRIRAQASDISDALWARGYPSLLTRVLASRGLVTDRDIDKYINTDAASLHEPLLMKDMEKARDRLRLAIDRGERVAVYGDYDVDGISSVCVVADYLRSRGLECLTYIPDRIDEGYGLNNLAICKMRAEGVSLMVTVDCGITALDEVQFAKECGIEVIVTDHHRCASEIPDAVAVVDQMRADCAYPNKNLAGVGVAYKLICAVDGDATKITERYCDLVAMGTVADVMELSGENRYIVQRGLEKLNSEPRLGVEALISRMNGEGREITSTTLSFSLSPRINAAGRLGKAELAVELLMTQSAQTAKRLADELEDLNARRKQMEQNIWTEAIDMIGDEPVTAPIVLADDGWHQGVIGIVASRLADSYGVPTVMICLDGDMGKGSCRTVGDFNLYEALTECSEHLLGYGGHASAAGLTIDRKSLEKFRTSLMSYYSGLPSVHEAVLECEIEIETARELSCENVEALSKLEPFGSGNVRPTFYMSGVRVEQVIPIGGGKHVKLEVSKGGGAQMSCVFFGASAEEFEHRAGNIVDLAFTALINEFRGRRNVQLNLTDIRYTDRGELCRHILNGNNVDMEETSVYCPQRADFVKLWRQVTQSAEQKLTAKELFHLCADMSPVTHAICIRVFEAEGLIALEQKGERYTVRTKVREDKADLENNEFMRSLRARRGK